MFVKKGDYTVIAQIETKKQKAGNSKGQGELKIQSDPTKMEKIPMVGEEIPGMEKTAEFGKSKIITKAEEFKSKKNSIIHKGKIKTNPDWKSLTKQALSRAGGSLSDKIKRMMDKLVTKAPALNWRKELKKLFDAALRQTSWEIPNKRFVASGQYLYGRKNTGAGTFKTIVVAVDTSGSISQKQSELFLSEVMHLMKIADAEIMYIIYCSDDIHFPIDVVKRGRKPDFSLWKTTGGNDKGFIPPFQWIKENRITPSVFVYFTDTGGEMPDPKKYGISKYADKVIWFLATPEVYNKPPFGKSFWVPLKDVN